MPPEFWKYLSGLILLVLGLVYIFPNIWTVMSSKLFGYRANNTLDQAQNIKSSTMRAIVTGAVLGPVFSTCSPTYSLLLATVFPVSFISGIVYTLIYALGLSLVLLLISYFGSSLVRRLRIYADERGIFRKVLGLILAIVGLLIITGIDKKIQTAAIEIFDITSVEQGIIEKFLPSGLPTSPEVATTRDEGTDVENSNIPKLSIANPTLAPEIPASLTNWINSNPLTMANLK